jgi:hypothetical protein
VTSEDAVSRFYHVKIRKDGMDFYERDLLESIVITNIIKPYYEGGKILLGGMIMNAPEVERVQVYVTTRISYTIIESTGIHAVIFHLNQITRINGFLKIELLMLPKIL